MPFDPHRIYGVTAISIPTHQQKRNMWQSKLLNDFVFVDFEELKDRIDSLDNTKTMINSLMPMSSFYMHFLEEVPVTYEDIIAKPELMPGDRKFLSRNIGYHSPIYENDSIFKNLDEAEEAYQAFLTEQLKKIPPTP